MSKAFRRFGPQSINGFLTAMGGAVVHDSEDAMGGLVRLLAHDFTNETINRSKGIAAEPARHNGAPLTLATRPCAITCCRISSIESRDGGSPSLTGTQLFREIRARGYQGSRQMVSYHLSPWRKTNHIGKPKPPKTTHTQGCCDSYMQAVRTAIR
jgi:hypothetical protein